GMAQNLRGEKELVPGYVVAVVMRVDQLGEWLAGGGLLGCGNECFGLEWKSQSIQGHQPVLSDKETSVGDSGVGQTSAPLLLVDVNIRGQLPQFGFPRRHHRVVLVDR